MKPTATTRSDPSALIDSASLMPALLVAGLPLEPAAAAAALGLPFAAFGPARGGAWQADFDLPRGTSWRLLPEYGAALWLARDPTTALPRIAGSCRTLEVDIFDAVLRVAAIEGMWLTEARVMRNGMGWTTPLGGSAALRLLGKAHDLIAVSGTWSDHRGRAVAGELHRDGRLWAETHAQAERWLLAVAGPAVDVAPESA